jgi:hypothetical protein
MMAKNKKISEDIDYGDYPERMHPSFERKLKGPENPFAKNPAFEEGSEQVQKLATRRFKEVVDKVREVTGNQTINSPMLARTLVSEMMGLVPQIVDIESRHKDELENLAIESSLDEAQVPKDWFLVEAYLNRQPIDTSNFRLAAEELDDENEEEIKKLMLDSGFDIEDLTSKEIIELETHKRNIINAIIQGTAKKGHFFFQKPEIKAKLDAIDPRLYRMYATLMSINDFIYFTMEDLIDQMSSTGRGVAAMVELADADGEDGGEEGGGEESADTVIKAYGLIFPMLCHEILKGIEEAKGRYGLPEDPETRAKVMGQTDTLPMEAWSLRIGPQVVEKIRFALPDEIFDEENKGLINWFQMELYKLPAEEFLKIIGNAISDDTNKNSKATNKFKELIKIAKKNKEEYESFDSSEDMEDDGLDFLAGLGISRPD